VNTSDTATGIAALKRLWTHLSPRRRRQFYLLLGLVVAGAVAEVVSLGAVLPFLAVLTDPGRLFALPHVADWAKNWGIGSPEELILPMALIFAVAALATGALRMLLLWTSSKLAYATGADLSFEAYRRTLYQPYQVHVRRNSGEVISAITHKIGALVDILNQSLVCVSSLLILTAITAALLFINPGVALVATFGFGVMYAAIAWFSRWRLHHYGKRIADEQTQLVKSLQEGLGGIRDVLLDGSQPLYCQAYRRADLRLRDAQGRMNFISNSPRFVMESFGMVLIAALAFGLSRQPGGAREAIPALGALALGAQRVLPVLQQLYGSWTSIIGRQWSMNGALDFLDQPFPPELDAGEPEPLVLQQQIEFQSVGFRYASDTPWVLNGLDLVIPKGARVGFIGSTGSGKSTAIDVMMGLLTPQMGSLLVDQQPLTGARVRAWQRTLAHVPQSIYLADATLAENIAFGVPRDQIDMEKVRRAAARAQIAAYIESRPEGYDEQVGERGVRLSGGQRQRIGIARALYKEASVLVFDEATSALDQTTEQSVMEAIESLDRDLTIVQIAHRLTTLRNCDFIVELGHGRVVGQGTYGDLTTGLPRLDKVG
jgi:ATP-binding cassette subfamily B protein